MNENKFLRELKTLIYLVREYGICHIDFEIDSKNIRDTEKADIFYYQCHQGFYAAQDRVIPLLRKIILEQEKLKTDLKNARRERQKEEASKINLTLRRVKFQEQVLRKLMDAIAWQLFSYDLSTMRRLYCGALPVVITNSNLDSELSFIKQYKENHPCGFSLISDLTSFIQIGDVVTVDKDNGICISELKEGAVNDQIFEIIKDVSKTQCPEKLQQELKGKDDRFLQQFKRVTKQINKTYQVSETIATGYGTDLFTGQTVRIVQGDVQPNTFFDTLRSLSLSCHKKGYAISVVEDCLLIGVYDITKFPSQVFDAWNDLLKIKFPIYDMRASFFDPLSFPIFLHGFSDTFILELISGKKVIKMSIDIEKWLSTFEKDGCTIRWLSKKETSKINSKMKGGNRIFDINGQGIEIEKDGITQIIGHGIFSRLFTSFLTPSSAKQHLLTMFVPPSQ
ncbi:MAG: hypothetical protein E7596_02510 [Ruminococcaceae bacterium]|nr:hypothetical protein [Oscillospiraceae bacterium]